MSEIHSLKKKVQFEQQQQCRSVVFSELLDDSHKT